MSFGSEFASGLSDMFLDQFGLGDDDPSTFRWSDVSAISGDIDKSAQRQYIESGSIRNVRPRASEVMMQEPDITVVIKKRAFSSLVENYNMELMDNDEKLLIRATKKLFQNKCKIIATYERLTKIERLVSKNDGLMDNYFSSAIFGAVDFLGDIGSVFGGLVDNKTRAVMQTMKDIRSLTDPNYITTWVDRASVPYATDTGVGTGVFELTTVSSFNVTNSVKFGAGGGSMVIEDPNRLMIVSNEDIDIAITEASNLFSNNSFFTLTGANLDQSIIDLTDRLNQVRMERGAPGIRFIVNENTLLSKKIRAVLDRPILVETTKIVDGKTTKTFKEIHEIKFDYDAGLFGINMLTSLFAFGDSAVSLSPSATTPPNGLSEENITQGIFSALGSTSEASLFKQIVQNMYLSFSLKQNTRSKIKEFNERTNYVRKRMRLHYANKPIIQPMDVVYIFVSTKTAADPRQAQGLKYSFAGGSLLDKINDTVGKIDDAINDIKDAFAGETEGAADGNGAIVNERNAIAGTHVPMWLWSLLRNDFTRQAAGTCVFAGLAEKATHTYTGGRYTLTVNLKDNTSYLKMGKININPSLNVYNGALYDPLTPFKTEFDEASGFLRGETPPLLDDNIRLLNAGILRAKAGRNKGQTVNQGDYESKEIEQIADAQFGGKFKQGIRRKFVNPDGFVYRWKQGIGSLVVFGEPYSDVSVGSYKTETSPNLTKDPFAGQDVMNVISLLITGKPYNFNNYIKGAIDAGKLDKNELTGKPGSASFFRGLVEDISDDNATWGNFVPFKELIINTPGYNFLVGGEFDLIKQNTQLTALLKERAMKFDRLTSVVQQAANVPQFYDVDISGRPGGPVSSGVIDPITKTTADIIKLDMKITELQDDFSRSKQERISQSKYGTLGIFGNDISLDPTITGESDVSSENKKTLARLEFSKKVNYLTRRRLWRVKANNDQNLFIVDDSYDKNYDLQAFIRSITGVKLFDSEFTNVFDKVGIAANVLGLEVFADSQGNIQARPPRYNKMPSSVYLEMLQKKAETGVQIFPDYLEKLFFNKMEGMTTRLEIVEENLRIRAAALGFTSDSDAEKMLSSQSKSGGKFKFISASLTGNIGDGDLRELFKQDAPELQEDTYKRALTSYSKALDGPLNAQVNFDIVNVIDIVSKSERFALDNRSLAVDRVTELGKRLKKKTNQEPPGWQDLYSGRRGTVAKGSIVSQTDLLNLTNDIAKLVAERQTLIKSLAGTIKNLSQGLSVNEKDSKAAQSILRPNINKQVEYPEMIAHMIEDEDNHDLGPNSGRRYILEDNKIISLTIEETPPEHTLVQVTGALETGLVEFAQGLALQTEAGGGGNAQGTAFAVDYDMWRMYGFRSANPVTAPFFSNPYTQCAPYAVYLLNLARKNIFKGTATVIGNEFIQAGEVYYIEDRDLLFYSDSVRHSFTYNQSYQTELTLTYGRNPGEYIPTQLDIIGKGLYSNRYQANLSRQVRQDRADSSEHIVTVVHDASVNAFTEAQYNIGSLVGGIYGEQNKENLAKVLFTAAQRLAPSEFEKKARIEVRVYWNTNPDIKVNVSADLLTIAASVKEWLSDPKQYNISDQSVIPDFPNAEGVYIDKDLVSLVVVDLNEKEGGDKSPSHPAMSAVRSILASGSEANLVSSTYAAADTVADSELEGAQQLAEGLVDAIMVHQMEILVNSVIDIWMVFEEQEETLEAQPADTGQKAQQENEEAMTKAKSFADKLTIQSSEADNE